MYTADTHTTFTTVPSHPASSTHLMCHKQEHPFSGPRPIISAHNGSNFGLLTPGWISAVIISFVSHYFVMGFLEW